MPSWIGKTGEVSGEIPWSQRFFLIFPLRKAANASRDSCLQYRSSLMRGKSRQEKNEGKALGPG